MTVGVQKDVLCRIDEVSGSFLVPGDDVPSSIDKLKVEFVVSYPPYVGVAFWVVGVLVVFRFSLDMGGERVFQSRGDWVDCVYKVSILVRHKRDLDLIQVGRWKLDLC